MSTPPHSPCFRISLLVAVGLLCLLFGSIYAVVATALANSSAGEHSIGMVTGVVAAAYLIASLGQAFPASNRVVTSTSRNPQDQRLLTAVAAVCGRFGIAPIKTVMRPDPKPNLRSCGIVPGAACLYVNRGLLDVLQDRAQLEGAVAHEIAHLVRFDTLFFSITAPLLWVFRHALAVARKAVSGAGKSGRGINLSPFVFLMLLRSGHGCFPVLGVLLVLLVAGLILILALSYVAFAILGSLAVAAICQFYCRYAEREADALAARVCGNSDAIVAALAECIDYYPSEVAALNAFVAENFTRGAKPAGPAILSALKAGAPAACGTDFRGRLLRSHPFALERMAALLNSFGTQIV